MVKHDTLPSNTAILRWRDAFLALNQERLDATRSQMTKRQQAVIDVLAVLLHVNHPRLPGFVTADTPCGVRGFTPSIAQRSALHTLARGVQLPRDPAHRSIHALYLMGSLGSVAQSSSSDLDVWVCHDELLRPQHLAALRQKCDLIEQWAAQQNCEVHFFLMNLTEFRQGQSRSADGEDCGSTQHLLLLDEFYRSALWLAGACPRWWAIPLSEETRADSYWQRLVDNHIVSVDQWLDVGSIATIPAAEFVGAGLWQLNKGLANPYKSLLKLLLTRHYASQYPRIRPLCWDLKEQVQNSGANFKNCDAYRLMLGRIQQQLQQEGNAQRVELVRRAFYYKADLPLTELNKGQRDGWRAQELLALTSEWGWDQNQLIALDQRQHWSPQTVSRERNALVSEMLSSYRYLAIFSQRYASRIHIQPRDLKVLGNRLTAAFETRPGKIIQINPGIRSELEQEKITLNLKNSHWQLYPGPWRPNDNQAPLRQSESLVELLAFARYNGLLHDYTQIALYPQHNSLTQYELRELLGVMKQLPSPKLNNSALTTEAYPLALHIFVNAGVDPQHQLSRRGMQKISNRDDSLGYSSTRENLVHTADVLSINSWGEWQVSRYEGHSAIADILAQMLTHRELARQQGWPEWYVHCHCVSRAIAIRERVTELLTDVTSHFSQPQPSPYLLQIGADYHLLEIRQRKLHIEHAESPQALLTLLARPRKRYQTWQLDRHALPDSPLRLILEESRSGIWQVYYWRDKDYIFVYVCDERGALFFQQWPESDLRQWLIPLLRFMYRLDQRWQYSQNRVQARPIKLAELKLKPLSYEFECERRRMPDDVQLPAAIDLHAVIDNQRHMTFYCNGQEFRQSMYGDQLFSNVANHVRELRHNAAAYDCRLTDLILADNEQLVAHLTVRQRLEKRLSETLISTPI